MLYVLGRPVVFQHGGLLPVGAPQVRPAVLPAIQTGFVAVPGVAAIQLLRLRLPVQTGLMLPVIILAAQRGALLYPRSTRVRQTEESRGGRRILFFSVRSYGVSFALRRGRSARHSFTNGPARCRAQYQKGLSLIACFLSTFFHILDFHLLD